MSDDEILNDWEIDLTKCTEVVVRLLVNTHTYGGVETIMREVGDSLDWLRYDHHGVLRGTWEVAG